MNRRIYLMIFFLFIKIPEGFSIVFLDEDKSISFTMRAYTQGRMSTNEPYLFRKGVNVYDASRNSYYFESTYGTGKWSLLQHRTYLEPQLNIDLSRREKGTPALQFLKDYLSLDNIRFFMGIRVEYDGIYDYGPDLYRNRLGEDVRDKLRLKKRIFEVYGDFRLFQRISFRVGKQNLSWGETDLFRILDNINPLDQTFGGFLIPLDERRVPSFMIKGLLDLGSGGPFYNISLEGFVEPFPALVEGPTLPAGGPWSVITGPKTPLEFRLPQKEDWKDSRGGAKLTFNFLDLTMSLANYWTYPELPTPRLDFDPSIEEKLRSSVPEAADALHEEYPAGIPYIELAYPRIMVSGATISGPLPFSPYTIIRTEVAYFWSHPYFIPEKSLPILEPALNLPSERWRDVSALLDTLSRQLSKIQSGEKGTLEKSDMIRWAVGFDRNIWIRFLNPRQTFFISGQFFAEHWRELKEGASFSVQKDAFVADVPVPGRDKPVRLTVPQFISLNPNNYRITFLIKTGYPLGRGYVFPQVAGVLDFGDFNSFSFLIQPSLQYYKEPFRVLIEYNWLGGDYSGPVGFFRDRDNIMLKLEYVL